MDITPEQRKEYERLKGERNGWKSAMEKAVKPEHKSRARNEYERCKREISNKFRPS